MDPGSLIHRERYPIDEPAHPLRTSTVGRVRADLSRDGCAVLDGFLSRQGLETILEEAAGRCSQAYFAGKHLTNAYFTRPDPA
ncbi:MAG: hypothetical protein F4Z15_10075, partial [Gammaproteobacteria bacterium]|nr:hypothetical protein [Gammaproteobacteria bacterium]